jgi:Zn-dependent membrane protease YugP
MAIGSAQSSDPHQPPGDLDIAKQLPYSVAMGRHAPIWRPPERIMMLFVLILAGLVLLYGPHLWARYVIARYNRDAYFSGNGFELARLLLDRLAMTDVAVAPTPGGDHYDPTSRTIGLTEATCGRRTLTAVVVASHEVGHAIQDRLGYAPLKTRTRLITAAVKLERIGAGILLMMPLIALVTRIPAAGALMLLGGLATLGIPLVVHLVTLPTEWDASFNRALPLLVREKLIPPEDLPRARRILIACALTYVANALVGLLNVWRWIRILRR